jgi:5'-nucleotidase
MRAWILRLVRLKADTTYHPHEFRLNDARLKPRATCELIEPRATRGLQQVGRAVGLAALVTLLTMAPGPGIRPASAQYGEEPSSPRIKAPVTFLQLNDVYTMLPVGGVDGLGGLARVATEKQGLAAAGRTPLLVMAGDFLSPSVASTVFKGAQMIQALNATGLDFATLGNHEFDFGDDVLIQRMKEATFTWVVSNVIDTRTNKPIGGAEPYVVRTYGNMTIGFVGLCLNTSEITSNNLSHTKVLDPIAAAREYIPLLKQQGANVIVAITHVPFTTDRALAQAFPEIDLIIGGHEHFLITAVENRTLISKAGADARTVARIDLTRQDSGAVGRFYELIPMSKDIPDEPRTAGVIAGFERRLGDAYDQVIGTTRVPLDGDSRHLRVSETNLGNFVADAMRAASHADIALTNSGGIRGNRITPIGPLTRRAIVEVHPFSEVICELAITGRRLLEVLNFGVANLPGAAGKFPQVSGMTMVVDAGAPVGQRISDVRIGGAPIVLNKNYTIAIPDYLLRGGDGYTMFAGLPIIVGPESGTLMVSALEKAVAAQHDIAPAIDGRTTIR